MFDVPYYILKKILVIRQLNYPYSIDEDGNGIANIDSYKVSFFVNEYGEIDLTKIRLIK